MRLKSLTIVFTIFLSLFFGLSIASAEEKQLTVDFTSSTFTNLDISRFDELKEKLDASGLDYVVFLQKTPSDNPFMVYFFPSYDLYKFSLKYQSNASLQFFNVSNSSIRVRGQGRNTTDTFDAYLTSIDTVISNYQQNGGYYYSLINSSNYVNSVYRTFININENYYSFPFYIYRNIDIDFIDTSDNSVTINAIYENGTVEVKTVDDLFYLNHLNSPTQETFAGIDLNDTNTLLYFIAFILFAFFIYFIFRFAWRFIKVILPI